MDKVIIDGIDVSECEHYRAEIETKMPYGEYEIQKDKCHYSGIEVIQNCKGNKGCIYKRLQRAKADIEDLKTYIKKMDKPEIKTIDSEIALKNIELQAENEKLKTDIAIYQGIIDSNKEENERLKARLRPLEDSYFKGLSSIQIAELAKKSIRITTENRELEYALQEIRDIAEEGSKSVYADEDCDKILDKINEVIGAE